MFDQQLLFSKQPEQTRDVCPFCVPTPKVATVLFCESCRVRELGELRSWLDAGEKYRNKRGRY